MSAATLAADLPPSMRVSVLRAPRDVALEERPVPRPGPGEVLVRVASVGVCGSDVHYYEDGRIGSYVVEQPLVLGHEAGGRVVAVGEGVQAPVVGQRVSLEPGIPCRGCEQCLAGRYNLCPDVAFFATPPVDGAFREYVAVPALFAHPVPDALSDDAAALLEPLSVAVWACRLGGVSAGSHVLVTGAGPVGLLCAQTARACGATQVWVSDVNPQRLAVAEELGATPVDAAAGPLEAAGVRPDVLLECSGNAGATVAALRVLAPAGRAVLVGMGADELPLPLSVLQNRELTITGCFRYANTWPTAIELVTTGAVDLDRLVTARFGLGEVEAALTAARRDPATIKVVVRPQPTDGSQA